MSYIIYCKNLWSQFCSICKFFVGLFVDHFCFINIISFTSFCTVRTLIYTFFPCNLEEFCPHSLLSCTTWGDNQLLLEYDNPFLSTMLLFSILTPPTSLKEEKDIYNEFTCLSAEIMGRKRWCINCKYLQCLGCKEVAKDNVALQGQRDDGFVITPRLKLRRREIQPWAVTAGPPGRICDRWWKATASVC